jgi:hypothetical protein
MVNAFDENKNPITDLKSHIVSKCEVRALLKLTGVNLAQGKCGYAFDVIQLIVYKPATLPSYAFIDDEDDHKPVNTKYEYADEEQQAPSHNTHTVDSDAEDNESEGGTRTAVHPLTTPPASAHVTCGPSNTRHRHRA